MKNIHIGFFLLISLIKLSFAYPVKITFGNSEIYSFISSAKMFQTTIESSLDTLVGIYSPETIFHNENKISGAFFETAENVKPPENPDESINLEITDIEIGGIKFKNEIYGVNPYTQPIIKFNKKVEKEKDIKSVEIYYLSNKEIVSGSINQLEEKQIKFTPYKYLPKSEKYKLTANYQEKNYSLFFYTVLDSQKQNIITANDEKTKIKIETGILPEDSFIIINTEPENNLISEADKKIKNSDDRFVQIIPETLREFMCFKSPEEKISNLNSTFEISIPYRDIDLDGIVDNSSPKIISRALCIYKLNEGQAKWEEIPSFVDEKNCLVSARTNQFGIFSIIGRSYKDVQNVYAYPVPFEKEKGHKFIKFGKNPSAPLPSSCKIRIYTISGELIRELEETDGDGTYIWQDIEDKKGRELSSGVYIYIIDSGEEKKSGKIMIIR